MCGFCSTALTLVRDILLKPCFIPARKMGDFRGACVREKNNV